MKGCARPSPIRNGGSPARPTIVGLPQRFLTILALIGLVMGLVAAPGWAERTRLKPGVNLFTPEQDIELGKQNAAQAEKQLRMLNDPRVDKYLNDLGQKLAARAPGYKFPYQYKCVNDVAINAFALPGGFIYINRGAIEVADTEAQLAGVMAHETSHAALRHGTNQATKVRSVRDPRRDGRREFGDGFAGAARRRLLLKLDSAEVLADRRDPSRRHGHANSLRRGIRSARDCAIL